MQNENFYYIFDDLELRPGVTAKGSAYIVVKDDGWKIGDIVVGRGSACGVLERTEALFTLIEAALRKKRSAQIWQTFYEEAP